MCEGAREIKVDSWHQVVGYTLSLSLSGYWHGNVQVRTRRVREVEDLICFLEEVTTLCCIRHENIQLFMGACLSMQKGSLAFVMR